MEVPQTLYWRKCSTCKKSIEFSRPYWACNISTCNNKRTGLVFCSVNCWDAHLPVMRHKSAWSEEKRAPKTIDEAMNPPPVLKGGNRVAPPEKSMDKEILIVASKLKAYIKEKSDMNTSGEVMDTLSDRVRNLCDDAIIHARQEGRKTVMSRDFV